MSATGPLVFAHRGSSQVMPEHTLAAYRQALREGADGLECDVRMTRDGHLVCVHDRRLDRTSNGRGRVSTRTLAELQLLDFGSWHAGAADDMPSDIPLDPDRTRLLTLDRLLHEVRAAGRPVELLVETKHPTRYGGDVERRLVDLLRRHGLADPGPDDPVRVTVMSFSPLAVRRIRELAPRLPTVMLLTDVFPRPLWSGRLPFGVRIAGPSINLVRARPRLVTALKEAGNRVFVWTVNESDDIELVLDCGVDGIITDRPATVLTRLGR
ncbi:MAG TPA: glycerophosphodiester phosphodiesterase family protein [Micromonosporaceae bacterium]